MAPNKKGNVKPSPGSQPGVPPRYRCKVGGEWKSLQYFSKNQQRLIQRQISMHGDVDAANSGMTCVEHSVSYRGELRCELCGLIKSIDEFSKSMRRSDEPTCLRCTAWGEIQEPGVTPMPLQTGHISIEEENGEVWNKRFTKSTDFFPNAMPQAPITAMSSLGIGDGASSDRIIPTNGRNRAHPGAPSSSRGPSSVVSAPVSIVSSGPTPPHLESIVSRLMQNSGLRKLSDPSNGNQSSISATVPINAPGYLAGDKTPSVVGSAGDSEMEGGHTGQTTLSSLSSRLPPHLQGKFCNMASRAALFQHAVPWSSSQASDAGTISTATTMRSEQGNENSKTRIPYNAWDNAGNLHEAIKSPTISETDTTSTSSNFPAPSASGQWETVAATKNGGPKSKKGWHKAPRLESVPQVATGHISAVHIDPDIDRQRRMNYCDSEDSSY